jgi:hypothetical protein
MVQEDDETFGFMGAEKSKLVHWLWSYFTDVK